MVNLRDVDKNFFDLENNLDNQLKDIKKIYYENKDSSNILKNDKNIKIEKIGKFNFIYLLAENYPSKFQKLFIDNQKKKYDNNSIIFLASSDNQKISIIIGLTKDITLDFDARELIKIAASIIGGKGGGGRKDFAQSGGVIIEKIKDIPQVIKNEILKLT